MKWLCRLCRPLLCRGSCRRTSANGTFPTVASKEPSGSRVAANDSARMSACWVQRVRRSRASSDQARHRSAPRLRARGRGTRRRRSRARARDRRSKPELAGQPPDLSGDRRVGVVRVDRRAPRGRVRVGVEQFAQLPRASAHSSRCSSNSSGTAPSAPARQHAPLASTGGALLALEPAQHAAAPARFACTRARAPDGARSSCEPGANLSPVLGLVGSSGGSRIACARPAYSTSRPVRSWSSWVSGDQQFSRAPAPRPPAWPCSAARPSPDRSPRAVRAGERVLQLLNLDLRPGPPAP